MRQLSPLERQRQIIGLQIQRCALPRVAKEVLVEALERAIATVTHEQQQGIAPLALWCPFECASWAAQLHLDPVTLTWTLELLATAGILRFEPDAQTPTQGIVFWNLAFEAWQPLQPQVHREAVYQDEFPSLPDQRTPSECFAQRWKGRPPRQVWWALRQAVLARDEYMCVYCGRRSGRLTLDHVVPVSRGGSSVLENLVTACVACNSAKATRTPEEWLAALEHQPRRRQRR